MPVRSKLLSVLILLILFASISQAQPVLPASKAQKFYDGIPENFKKQINNAIPKQAVVEHKKKRKLLVVNYNIRDKKIWAGHASIPYANYAIYQMGEKTGAYETYFSDDTLAFKAETLAQFDAVILNNTVGVLFESASMRQGLLDYVYSGKGIMGIHGGAGATFVQYPVYDQFPEFGEMMGGYENGGHPWKTHEWINMKANEPAHPINAAFEGADFNISDEIYQYATPYSRDHLRILLSVNTEKTDMSTSRHFLAERKLDNDFPVSWVRSYGKGRVFNTSLGHHPHINWDMRILHHNFRAIQYVLGDLPAPAMPSNKLTSSIIAQEKLGWRFGLAVYSFKDLTLFETVDKAAELGIWYLDGLNVQKVSPAIDKQFDYKLSKDELLMVRQKLLSQGIVITNYYIHNIPNNEEECRKIFEFGKFMGIEAFISEPKPEALDLIENYCEEYDIQLAIHNHKSDISPEYWDPRKLMEQVKGRSPLIGACGDVGYWIRSGISPVNAIETLGERLITLQMHDLHDLSEDGHDVAWGTGASKAGAFLEILASKNIRPNLISLEYSYNWGKSMPDIKKSKVFFDETVVKIGARIP